MTQTKVPSGSCAADVRGRWRPGTWARDSERWKGRRCVLPPPAPPIPEACPTAPCLPCPRAPSEDTPAKGLSPRSPVRTCSDTLVFRLTLAALSGTAAGRRARSTASRPAACSRGRLGALEAVRARAASGEVCLGVGRTGRESCSVRALLPPTSNIRPAPAPGRLTQLWGSFWAGRGPACCGLACRGPAPPEQPFPGGLVGCGQNVQPARGGHWVCGPHASTFWGPRGSAWGLTKCQPSL